MFELMVAAKLLLTAPQTIVGIDRAKIEAKFGRPDGVGTDFVPNPSGPRDRVVTLDWPQLRIRLYVSTETKAVSLLNVTTTSDLLKIDSPVKIGADRGTILRELGGPLFEDEDQLIYSLTQDDPDALNETVRVVFKDDRVVGIDWTYPIR